MEKHNQKGVYQLAIYVLIGLLTMTGVYLVYRLAGSRGASYDIHPGILFTQIPGAALLLHSVGFYVLLRAGVRKAGCRLRTELLVYVGSGLLAAFLIFLMEVWPYVSDGYRYVFGGFLQKLLYAAVYYCLFSFLLAAEDIVVHAAVMVRKRGIDNLADGMKTEGTGDKGRNQWAGNRYVKFFGISFFVLITLVTSKAVCGYFLKMHGIFFRSWVEVAAYAALWFGIPVTIAGFLFYLLLFFPKGAGESDIRPSGRSLVRKTGAFLLGAACTVYFGGFLLVLLFRFESTFERETPLGGLLMGTVRFAPLEASLLINYYDDYNIFTKHLCLDDDVIVCNIMAERYQEEFIVTEQRRDHLDYFYGKGYFAGEPETEIALAGGPRMYGSYTDDRNMARAYKHIQDFTAGKRMGVTVVPEYTEGLLTALRVNCTYDNLEESAGEIADIIKYVLEDDYYSNQEHGAELKVVCGKEEKYYNVVMLYFGNINGNGYYNGNAWDYYSEAEHVYEALDEVFRDNIYAMDSADQVEGGDLVTSGKLPEEGGRIDYEAWQAEAEKDLTTPEGAFQKLYDTVFAQPGKDYERCYNAKGNYYALLETGEALLDGEMRETLHTVVYDRESQNGKCQLFVEYLEYMQKDEYGKSVYSTDILEFYAVNMATGEVAAAEKTSWSELGSEEYREMTGE